MATGDPGSVQINYVEYDDESEYPIKATTGYDGGGNGISWYGELIAFGASATEANSYLAHAARNLRDWCNDVIKEIAQARAEAGRGGQ